MGGAHLLGWQHRILPDEEELKSHFSFYLSYKVWFGMTGQINAKSNKFRGPLSPLNGYKKDLEIMCNFSENIRTFSNNVQGVVLTQEVYKKRQLEGMCNNVHT